VTDVAATLAERGARYGKFTDHAACTQDLKHVMQGQRGWDELPDDAREALEMIQHKVGRILCGDPNYADSWHDIAGYAKLVEDRINNVDSNKIQLPVWTPEVRKQEVLFPEGPSLDTRMNYDEEVLATTFGNYGGSE